MSDKDIFEKLKQERDAWAKENGKLIVKNKCDAQKIEAAKREREKRRTYKF